MIKHLLISSYALGGNPLFAFMVLWYPPKHACCSVYLRLSVNTCCILAPYFLYLLSTPSAKLTVILHSVSPCSVRYHTVLQPSCLALPSLRSSLSSLFLHALLAPLIIKSLGLLSLASSLSALLPSLSSTSPTLNEEERVGGWNGGEGRDDETLARVKS